MAKRKDAGHDETERVLAEMEKRIAREYAQAEKELTAKIEDYFAKFAVKDELKLQGVKNGHITIQEYQQWRLNQLAVGQRWEDMRNTIVEEMAKANMMANAVTYGYMPEVYLINFEYGTYQVEKIAKVDTSFTKYDQATALRMFQDDEEFYHQHGWKVGKHINEGKLIPWEKKQAQSIMTQSILQGESVGKIATRLQKGFGNSVLKEDIKNWQKMTAEAISKELARRNRHASIRNARTMATGCQNAGRVDSYKRAEGMGIKLKQEWLATLDGRTRHEHRLLDGQRVEVGKPFVVDGYEIEYPGDPTAEAHLVYNCRCTLVPVLDGFEVDSTDLKLRNTNHMQEESYEEWKESHDIHSDPITKQDEIEKRMKAIYSAEYKSYTKKKKR